MATAEGSSTSSGTEELTTVEGIIERYQLQGPHATVVMQLSLAGQVGDDRIARWHARRTELTHLGARPAALGRLDDLVSALDGRGQTVLLTANETSAAHCWLIDHDTTPFTQVGDHPALLPAIAELSDRAPVIAAIVDHLGAGIHRVDHLDIVGLGVVKGEHVQTHRHTGGDQAGYQRRADAVYERNAETIAQQITDVAVEHHATLIVLTGDDREVAAVEQHLDVHRFAVRSAQAGSRHEADAVTRIHAAATAQALTERQRHIEAAVEELRRALGQHSLGVEGHDVTIQAIGEARVATLFIDRTNQLNDADATARDTLIFGGRVLVVDDLGVADGIGALLRYD